MDSAAEYYRSGDWYQDTREAAQGTDDTHEQKGILKCSYPGLNLLHSPLEKSIIERTIENFKDRTEVFGDYYPMQTQN